MSDYKIVHSDELYHYGVPGMRWGHRKARPEAYQQLSRSRSQYKIARQQAKSQYKQAKKEYRNNAEVKEIRAARTKKALKVGAAAASAALATYGGYKLNQYVKTKNCQIAAERGIEYAQKKFRTETRLAREFYNGGKVSITVPAGDIARNEANRASYDSFRTAAKNVIDYKRKNGSLNLASVDFYSNMSDLYDSFGNIKRRR